MFTLYDVEEVQRIHLESELREARKVATAEGRAEGRVEGKVEGKAEGIVQACKMLGSDRERAAEMVAQSLEVSPAEAREIVQRLW